MPGHALGGAMRLLTHQVPVMRFPAEKTVTHRTADPIRLDLQATADGLNHVYDRVHHFGKISGEGRNLFTGLACWLELRCEACASGSCPAYFSATLYGFPN